MRFMRLSQGFACAIVIPMYITGTPNVLLLTTLRWIPVTITVIPCKTPRALKIITNKGLKDDLYISIPIRITTSPISEGFLLLQTSIEHSTP